MNEFKNGWQPIETAPKDKKILLGYDYEFFNNGGYCTIGIYISDEYSKYPKPYFRPDMHRLCGLHTVRKHQPIAWMPLPEKP